MSEIETLASPNFGERRSDIVDAVILHYTAGGHYMSSARWLCQQQAKVSAHYVIGRKGNVVQLVSSEKRAWHAGKGVYTTYEGERRENPNDTTIGIELANHGRLEKIDGRYYYRIGRVLRDYRKPGEPEQGELAFKDKKIVRGWWEPYYDEQLQALQSLLLTLVKSGYEKAAANLQGHDEIADPPGRKIDPGPLFPWSRFSRKHPRALG